MVVDCKHYTNEEPPQHLRWLFTGAIRGGHAVTLLWFEVDELVAGRVAPLAFEGDAIRVRTETGRETTIALWDCAEADVIAEVA
jgi:hypothetical protein